jgi:hypothetical protein
MVDITLRRLQKFNPVLPVYARLYSIDAANTKSLIKCLPVTVASNGLITVENVPLLNHDPLNADPNNGKRLLTVNTNPCTLKVTGQEETLITSPVQYRLWPSPSGSYIQIESGGNLTGAEISIYSMLGEKVFAQIANSSPVQINVEPLASGVYVVLVQQLNQVHQLKFIRQ